MLERFGTAVVEERRYDRRFAALEDYLKREYGSTGGMERYVAETNHTSSPRSGLRALLAKIAGVVLRSSSQVATPAASVEPAFGDERAEYATPQTQSEIAMPARPVRYRRSLSARPRSAVPPLKR